jgi:tRNA-Thr(GGU) m(6)t(6)A37 methyltransferase TsaA
MTEQTAPIALKPIGVIRSPYRTAEATPIQGVFGPDVEATIELSEEYAQGLSGLEGFSHAIILYAFHRSQREELVTRPLLGGADRGIFATRSPHRPNHIGLSVIGIRAIEGARIRFSEVDVLDGTPVLDIKPYVERFDGRNGSVCGWLEERLAGDRVPEGAGGSQGAEQ